MKKIFFLIVTSVILFISGCNKFERETFRSFVYKYFHSESIFMYETDDGNISLVFSDRTTACDWKSKGRLKELYDSLCYAHNDMSYNKEIMYFGSPIEPDAERLSINNIVSINVVSNANFDEQHPAGSSLNDVIRFMGTSLYEFLQSNYTYKYDWENKPVEYTIESNFSKLPYEAPRYALLSELTADDMRLMTVNIGVLHFIKEPTLSKTHELKIIATLDNGETISGYSQGKIGNKADRLPYITKVFD